MGELNDEGIKRRGFCLSIHTKGNVRARAFPQKFLPSFFQEACRRRLSSSLRRSSVFPSSFLRLPLAVPPSSPRHSIGNPPGNTRTCRLRCRHMPTNRPIRDTAPYITGYAPNNSKPGGVSRAHSGTIKNTETAGSAKYHCAPRYASKNGERKQSPGQINNRSSKKTVPFWYSPKTKGNAAANSNASPCRSNLHRSLPRTSNPLSYPKYTPHCSTARIKSQSLA